MEEAQRYTIIFSGKISPELSLEQVKSKATTSLNLSDSAVNKLFSPDRKPVVIKRDAGLQKANTLVSQFEKIGMLLSIKAIKNNANSASSNMLTENSLLSDDEGIAQHTEKGTVFEWFNYYKQTIILVLSGLLFVIAYSPFPDGYLRKGFIVGLLLLGFGYRSFRIRS